MKAGNDKDGKPDLRDNFYSIIRYVKGLNDTRKAFVELQHLWASCLSGINMDKQGVKPNPQGVRPLHAALLHPDWEAHEFEKVEIHKVLCIKCIETTYSELVLEIVPAPKKDGLLRFCHKKRKLDTVMVKHLYLRSIREMKLNALEKVCICSTRVGSSG